ncbi:MAG: CDGSH iron-sulfur domain-containing protein [Rhodospirillales bacterium]|nr:MAG: CDGSH iron-sulfur domain-containing protein [Rhodospirillales bacterium]
MPDAVIAQRAPFAMAVEAGRKYAWCACGRSSNQPLCDGSHKETDMSPVITKAERTETVYFCGCKQTAVQPFCDGTHKQL